MRILHTSDWHVGRAMRGRSRDDEHRAVLAEIAAIARGEQVDVVIVAGDLFDSAAPSPEAESIVYEAVLELVRGGAEVVLLAGNHDNPRRLDAVRPLLQIARVHAAPFLARPDEGGCITIETRAGERARIALMPFLSQRGIVKADELMALDAADHQGQYRERFRQVAEALTAGFEAGAVNVLVAHAAVDGAWTEGSERQAHTAFEYMVPSQCFPANAHYIALGHFHISQNCNGRAPTWYSGSPLQLDFGDNEDRKCVLLVEAAASTPARVERRYLSAGRPLKTVSATLAQLQALAPGLEGAWLRVRLDELPRAGLADAVRDLLPGAVEVHVLGAPRSEDDPGDESRAGLSPSELFAQYLFDRGEEDARLHALFRELLEDAYAS